jgi:hypothetical protein
VRGVRRTNERMVTSCGIRLLVLRLARYVAGPVGLATLGVGLWGIGFTVAAIAAWVLAVVWATAALIGWWNQRFDLKGRAIHLANRVRRCVDGWWREPDFEPITEYGNNVTMARTLRGMHERQGRRVHPFWRRRYTARLHRKVEAIIKEMGKAGVVDNNLEPYLTERPPASQYGNLAIALWWAGCKLP